MTATAITLYNQMVAAIDRCHSVDVIKGIRSRAAALRHVAKVARNEDAERKYAEVVLRAERKGGQLLREARDQGELAGHGGRRRSRSSPSILNLRDIEVTPDESARWGHLADIPDDEFARQLAGSETPTRSRILRDLLGPHDDDEEEGRRRPRRRGPGRRHNQGPRQNRRYHLIAKANKARDLGNYVMAQLERNDADCSSETLSSTTEAAQVWSTVVQTMQDVLNDE
jgi:hypothetical protein